MGGILVHLAPPLRPSDLTFCHRNELPSRTGSRVFLATRPATRSGGAGLVRVQTFHLFPSGGESSLCVTVCSDAHRCRKWGTGIRKNRRAICMPRDCGKDEFDVCVPPQELRTGKLRGATGNTSVSYGEELPTTFCLPLFLLQ